MKTAREHIAKLSTELDCVTNDLDNVTKELVLVTSERDTATRERDKANRECNEAKVQLAATVTQEREEVKIVYFRGGGDVLSNFYKCKLIPEVGPGSNLAFNSAEHLYQYRKLIKHGLFYDAEKVRKLPTPGKAKSASSNALPMEKVSQEWKDTAGLVMEEVCLLKAKQCPAFRDALLDSSPCRLIHNMETDCV